MTARSGAHAPYSPADVASLLRLLAESADHRTFFATLRRELAAWLPDTRVDLLLSAGGRWLPLGERASFDEPPPSARQSAASFCTWLSGRGYAATSTLVINGAGQHLGWLALARQNGPFDLEALQLAGQIAALIAMRLLYDQSRDELAERNRYGSALERRLRQHEELRLRAMLAVGSIHDIGNLFASVMGNAQLIQQAAPPELQHDLGTIVQAARDGDQLMRRLLTLKPPSEIMAAEQHVSLPDLAQDALDLTRPFWEQRTDLAIKNALGSAPMVRAHAAELREVLINLILNAISAMPSGGLLTLRTFRMGDQAVAEVADTGPGIAAEEQQAIFEPATSSRAEGGGYGLSVSRLIAEGYGGTLTVRSAVGQGATFRLALPIANPHALAPDRGFAPLRMPAASRS